MLRVIRVC